MQLRKATPLKLSLICALALSAFACEPEDKPGTAIVLSVKSDIEELAWLQVKVLDGDATRDDEADEHTEQAEFAGVDEVAHVAVTPGKSDKVLIVVSGFDGKKSKSALAEVSFRATFEQGKTLQVPVFLGNVCLKQFCKETQSCSGGPIQDTRECASIRALAKGEYTHVPVDEADPQWDWDAEPLRSCMDGGIRDEEGRCFLCEDGGTPLPDGGCPTEEPRCGNGGRMTADGGCPSCADGAVPLADGRCPEPPVQDCDGGMPSASGDCTPPAIQCDAGTLLPDGTCSCPDGGVRSDAGACVSRCTSEVPNATCDLVTQCGCPTGQACVISDINNGVAKLACVAKGTTLLPNQACDQTSQCPAGHHCLAGFCRAYCDPAVGCGTNVSAECLGITSGGVSVEGVNTCAPTCTSDAQCPGQYCRSDKVCTLDPIGSSCTGASQCLGAAAGKTLCVGPEGSATCTPVCKTNAECETGCCAQLMNGKYACSPADYCKPAASSSCAATKIAPYGVCNVNGDCCGYAAEGGTMLCVTQGTANACVPKCTSSATCSSSECCVPLQPTGDAGVSSGGVCAPRALLTNPATTCL